MSAFTTEKRPVPSYRCGACGSEWYGLVTLIAVSRVMGEHKYQCPGFPPAPVSVSPETPKETHG